MSRSSSGNLVFGICRDVTLFYRLNCAAHRGDAHANPSRRTRTQHVSCHLTRRNHPLVLLPSRRLLKRYMKARRYARKETYISTTTREKIHSAESFCSFFKKASHLGKITPRGREHFRKVREKNLLTTLVYISYPISFSCSGSSLLIGLH